jgi:GNAT superfamily N-acetyltransferase
MVLSPYNPAGYASLAERAGYEPFLDYYAYLWSPETEIAPVAARVLRAVVRRGERRVNVRPADPARWDGESRLLYELYNLTFADLWGYVPLSWEEFRARAASFRPFYRPELVLFAECDGRPVGFALTLPNINDALAGVDGRLLPFGWLHLLREVPRIQTGRFLLLGVAPEWRARGVAVALAAAMAAAARRLGMRRVELSLVQAGNRAVQSVIAACGGPRIKTYRLYQKRLA